MTPSQIFVLLVLFIPLILVFMNKLREDVAALLMAASLGIAQYLGLGVLGAANSPDAASKALEGFGTPEVITLMALFILTYSLDKYGITRWLAGRLVRIGGKSESTSHCALCRFCRHSLPFYEYAGSRGFALA